MITTFPDIPKFFNHLQKLPSSANLSSIIFYYLKLLSIKKNGCTIKDWQTISSVQYIAEASATILL